MIVVLSQIDKFNYCIGIWFELRECVSLEFVCWTGLQGLPFAGHPAVHAWATKGPHL